MERLETKYLNNLPSDTFDQISNLISEYNATHPGEMLPKTSEQLRKSYELGLSVILILPENPKLVIAHGALYPFGLSYLTEEGMELYEVGSLIVHPNFRHRRINGLTIGEFILEILTKKLNDPAIATVKRENTKRAFERIGFLPISFYNFPIITTLTCICSTSEHFNQLNCRHRTAVPGEKIDEENPNEPNKISCTLMGYNLEKLSDLEQKLAQKLGLITQASINPSFFKQVKMQLNQFGIII